MAKDDRLYAKFTLDFPDNPKIRPLSDAAFRCLVEATIWSRCQLTDGIIPKRYAVARWSLPACCELTVNDPDAPSFLETSETYIIHDFTEHQTTKAEIEAIKQVRQAAGKRGGIASGKTRRSKTEAKPKQTRSKTNPETETDLLDPYGSRDLDADVRARANGAPHAHADPTALCALCDDHGNTADGLRCGHPLWQQPEIFSIPSYNRPDFDGHENDGWQFILKQRNGTQ